MSAVLHYPGDQTAFDPEHWVGPDAWGAVSRPVAAEYDATTDRTTITFRSVPPAEVTARFERDVALLGRLARAYVEAPA